MIIRQPSVLEFNQWMDYSIKKQAAERAMENNSNIEFEEKQLRQFVLQNLPDLHETEGHFFRILDGDRSNVGFVWLGEFPKIPDQSLLIYDIFVDESLRGKGYGKFLLNEMHHEALENGYTHVFLQVLKSNNAKHLYSKVGYEVIEETENTLLMRKTLT